MFSVPTRYFLIFSAALTTSCGNIALQIIGGSGTNIQGLSASAEGASFSSRCGGKASELSDPNFVVMDQKMVSTPIVSSGTKSGINYEVKLQANITIHATSAGSTQETVVKVVDVVADDNGRFSRPEAEDQATKNSNSKVTKGMSSGVLLKLQNSDPDYKGIECSVGFTSESQVQNSEGTGVATFTPGLPTALNPRASAETFAKELGDVRAFTAKAKVKEKGKDWAEIGTEGDVVVTIRKVSTDASKISGVPADAPAIKADVAYEFTMTSNGRDVSAFGLGIRQVFFVDTEAHRIAAILDDSGRINAVDKKPIAPVLVVPSQ